MKNQYEIDYQQGYDKANEEWLDRIDKIRAEIEGLDGRYVIGDYAMYGESSPKYVRSWEVLQIIDKYKAESEPQESENT